MNDEFQNIKNSIINIKDLYLPDYKETFILKTDASNTGIGAVLTQTINNCVRPIEWASKKLTPTETRYSISEKEMLAVYWAVNKFEHELRGRKFKIITDHKALENMRENPNFKNNS